MDNTLDLRAEQKKIVARGAMAIAVAAAILLLGVLLLPALVAMPQDPWARLSVVLVCNLIIGLWVAVGVRLVSRVRFVSEADNAGAAYTQPSARIAVPKAFLQNTLEQAFLLVLGSLALLVVEGPAPLAYVVASVICFSAGRITFLIGYPSGAGGRAFGMVLTMIPFLGAVGWTFTYLLLMLLDF